MSNQMLSCCWCAASSLSDTSLGVQRTDALPRIVISAQLGLCSVSRRASAEWSLLAADVLVTDVLVTDVLVTDVLVTDVLVRAKGGGKG